MPETGGPNTVGEDVSRGEVRCDECDSVVISNVEKNESGEIKKAIDKHYAQTGHKDYSFYGRTEMEAA